VVLEVAISVQANCVLGHTKQNRVFSTLSKGRGLNRSRHWMRQKFGPESCFFLVSRRALDVLFWCLSELIVCIPVYIGWRQDRSGFVSDLLHSKIECSARYPKAEEWIDLGIDAPEVWPGCINIKFFVSCESPFLWCFIRSSKQYVLVGRRSGPWPGCYYKQ
jgi:hypothetical protein